MLRRLPDAPVPSNFTARVLQAVEREEEERSRRRWIFSGQGFLPRLAFAAVLVLCGSVAVHQYQADVHRTELAKSVAMVSSAPLPSVEALKNFDVIERMSSSQADDELLALAPEMK